MGLAMNYIPCIESVLIVRVQAGYGKQEMIE